MKQVSGQTSLAGFSAADKLPSVGTILYIVTENMYYDGKPYPDVEYLVCKAKVYWHETVNGAPCFLLTACIPMPSNVGYNWRLPQMRRPSEIGKRVFRTPKEAAELARDLTEKHDLAWRRDPPMRRTWERLLDGADFYLAPLISKRFPEGGGDFEI